MCFARHLESNMQNSQPGEKYLERNFNKKIYTYMYGRYFFLRLGVFEICNGIKN